jgi:two-component system OmpR family response regulator
MRILLIEDDRKTAAFIVKGLKESGFAIDHAANGRDGLVKGSAYDYDLLIVDLMLPEIDGLTVIKSIREVKPKTPIIILSAKHSIDAKITGLNLGADDYLTKPFAFTELLARIHALLRRSSGVQEATILAFRDLEINLLTRAVHRGGKNIELQQKEFSLLEYMLRNRQRVITRTMILEHVWDMNFDPSTNIVDVLVCRLREKIDKAVSPKLIHTVRGAGYVLKVME